MFQRVVKEKNVGNGIKAPKVTRPKMTVEIPGKAAQPKQKKAIQIQDSKSESDYELVPKRVSSAAVKASAAKASAKMEKPGT